MAPVRLSPALSARGRAQGRIIGDFCDAHAVTPYDTILYTPAPRDRDAFAAMVAARLIRREGRAYYWFDRNAWDAALAARQRRIVPVAIGVALAIAGVAMLFYQG